MLIEIKNLISKFHTRIDDKTEVDCIALNDVSLAVRKGDFIGIIGENGSGKTTLAKHLAALLEPTEGIVLIDGMDTRDHELIYEIRQTAGLVFQNPDNQFVAGRVEEEIAFGPENMGVGQEELIERVDYALEAVRMETYRKKDPTFLSGGQKQRIAIAGILAMRPSCIILDEPTAMLDPKGRKEVLDAIHELNRECGITIIYITHHINEIRDADYIYVMKKGEILREGPAEAVFVKEILEEAGLELPFAMRLQDILNQKAMQPEWILQQTLYDSVQKKIDAMDETIIHLDDVSYRYPILGSGEDGTALESVSVSIRKGRCTAIVGDTGSGKSTFLQVCNGLIKPDQGICMYEGNDIHSDTYSLRKHRMKVVLSFQYPDYQLFEETVLKDISFGPMNQGLTRRKAEEKAIEAMELLGIDQEMGKKSPFLLSGGEKRKVALAGVLAMEPEVLLLDEPAAGLDYRTREFFFQLIREMVNSRSMTVVFVTHDMDLAAAYADDIIVMKDGKVTASGETRGIITDVVLMDEAGLTLPEAAQCYKHLSEQSELVVPAERIPINEQELADILIRNSITEVPV